MRHRCVRRTFFLIPLLAAWHSAVANTPPVVSNVIASQRQDGSKLVDIRYSLTDAEGSACMIWIAVSNDGGLNWSVPAPSVTGAVGANVAPGSDKRIVWDCNADLPGAIGSLFKVRVYANDGQLVPMLVTIPAGEFQMGDTFAEGQGNEIPVHTVNVDTVLMDHAEVTYQQYAEALNWANSQGNLITTINGVVYKYNSGSAYPYCDTVLNSAFTSLTWDGTSFRVNWGKDYYPVAMVSWYGAAAYANWKSAMSGLPLSYDVSTWECNFGPGYRLPTEAEWEKAARGGSAGRRFSWSDSDEIQHARANYYSSAIYAYDTSPTRGLHPLFYTGGYVCTSPVGSFVANGYGLYGVGGDVWGWCGGW